MTKEDIIRMAREAGIEAEADTLCRYEGFVEPLERFAKLVAEKAIKEALAQPEQEPVAIHQFRSPHCADWYDGIPDHHDGHGPYEVRTLYTHPVKDLEDIDINITWNENSLRDFGKDELNFARAILGKAQEK